MLHTKKTKFKVQTHNMLKTMKYNFMHAQNDQILWQSKPKSHLVRNW